MANSSNATQPGYTDVDLQFMCPLCRMPVKSGKRPDVADFYVPPHDEECAYFFTSLRRAQEIRMVGGDRREALRQAIQKDNDRGRPVRL
jgi:hypothetical protein